MEFCKNCMIISNYLILLFCLIGEIVCLFLVPYYRYSNFLQSLKITRIILGVFLILIDCYFRANFFAEKLSKKKEKFKIKQNLLDKILDILGFSISCTGSLLNLLGTIYSFDYINTKAEPGLENAYNIGSLILFVENLIFLLLWLFFSGYWSYNLRKGFKKKVNRNKIQININNNPNFSMGEGAPPVPINLSDKEIPIENLKSLDNQIIK